MFSELSEQKKKVESLAFGGIKYHRSAAVGEGGALDLLVVIVTNWSTLQKTSLYKTLNAIANVLRSKKYILSSTYVNIYYYKPRHDIYAYFNLKNV